MSPVCSSLALLISVALACTATLAQNSPQDFVAAHNSDRAAVGVGPVTWDETVAAYAQNYASQRSGDCQLIHSQGGPYGENLFEGSGADYTATDAVNNWVSEQQYYDYNSNSCADGQQCGHYTQVVWRASTAIGCARAVCNNGSIFIICSYNPRGNYSEYTAAEAVNLWVSEKQYYDYNSNTCATGKVCGHYTQVVWRASTAIGCARVKCNNGGIFITCNYKPPGNYAGQRPY